MNYRHAFHAGNHGDCLKHALLVWLLSAMQAKLDSLSASNSRQVTSSASTAPVPAPAIDPALARKQAQRAAPGDVPEQERLFKTFMEWNRGQTR